MTRLERSSRRRSRKPLFIFFMVLASGLLIGSAALTVGDSWLLGPGFIYPNSSLSNNVVVNGTLQVYGQHVCLENGSYCPVSSGNGSAGPAGTNGTDGLNGTRWTLNTTFPSSPNINDSFLNTSTGVYWQWTGSAWVQKGNLTGPKGAQGETGPNGDPGPQGATGDPGQNGSNGTGVKNATVLVNGSLQLGLTNGTIWILDNITGATGPQGATGAAGQSGSNGTNGSFVNGSSAWLVSVNVTSIYLNDNTGIGEGETNYSTEILPSGVYIVDTDNNDAQITSTGFSTSGSVDGNTGSFTTSLTVNNENVCLADGTNCPATSSTGSGWVNTTGTVLAANNNANLEYGVSPQGGPAISYNATNDMVKIGDAIFRSGSTSMMNVNSTNGITINPDGDGMSFRILDDSGVSLIDADVANHRFIMGAAAQNVELRVVGRINTTGTINASEVWVEGLKVCRSDGTNCPPGGSGNSSWNESYARGIFITNGSSARLITLNATNVNVSGTLYSGDASLDGLTVNSGARIYGDLNVTGTIRKGGVDISPKRNNTIAQQVRTSNVPTPILNLSMPVAANEYSKFECRIPFMGNTTTSGLVLSLNITATTNNYWYDITIPTSIAAAAFGSSVNQNNKEVIGTASLQNGNLTAYIRGSINTSGAGSIIPRYRSEINGNNVTIWQGADCEKTVIT